MTRGDRAEETESEARQVRLKRGKEGGGGTAEEGAAAEGPPGALSSRQLEERGETAVLPVSGGIRAEQSLKGRAWSCACCLDRQAASKQDLEFRRSGRGKDI